MSLFTMTNELTGAIPKMPIDYAKTIINRAYKDIRRQNLWSFQLFESNWVSPNLISAGTVSVTQGTNTIVFNATASAAIIAAAGIGPFPTPITQRQFRIVNSTIYNIWAYDATGGVVTLTLDRPYTDSTNAASGYMIYQIYYPVPMQDFLSWINVRDIINYNDLITELTRKEIDFRDPQRTIFYLPTHCVGYQNDQNPNSPTSGWMMYELWGGILYQIVYQLYGIRKGTDLVNDEDVLPNALGEDCVMALSRYYAYEWAEANKGDMPRNQGSDYRFLMGTAMKQYQDLYKSYRRQDRETVDNWYEVRRHRSWLSNIDGYYNAIGGTASPGAPW